VNAFELVLPLIQRGSAMSGELSVNPIRKERVSHRIALEICRMIREGDLRPGDSLPAERELARRLEVSRSSLREALRGLEIGGIVETRHGGGTFVREFSPFGVESPLAMVIETSHELVGDLWEVRRIVEPALAERAAVRATGEGIDWLARMLEDHREFYMREGTGQIARRLDRDFHGAVARLSGNTSAEQVIQLINSLVHTGYHAHRSFILERRRLAYRRHLDILDAIKQRDPSLARKAMIDHLQEVEEYILGELIDHHEYEIEGAPDDVDSARERNNSIRKGR
jgi:GntR family transcriptional repressor for pyruvate dehydrogenase complex